MTAFSRMQFELITMAVKMLQPIEEILVISIHHVFVDSQKYIVLSCLGREAEGLMTARNKRLRRGVRIFPITDSPKLP